MNTRGEYIHLLQSCSELLRRQFGVRSLHIFGSVARGDEKEASDLDLCVNMAPDLYLFVELGIYLEELLGCRVDVVREHRNMNAFLKKEIEKDGIRICICI